MHCCLNSNILRYILIVTKSFNAGNILWGHPNLLLDYEYWNSWVFRILFMVLLFKQTDTQIFRQGSGTCWAETVQTNRSDKSVVSFKVSSAAYNAETEARGDTHSAEQLLTICISLLNLKLKHSTCSFLYISWKLEKRRLKNCKALLLNPLNIQPLKYLFLNLVNGW